MQTIPADVAALAFCHSHAVGILGAAIRLLPITHTQVQATLHRLHPTIARELRRVRSRRWQQSTSFTPELDLVAIGHETDDVCGNSVPVRSSWEMQRTRVPCSRAPVGIGGPVGSGKTALVEALVPRFVARGLRPLVITNDIFTSEDREHVRRTLAGCLDADRIRGVETGSCPHAAVRDDPSLNLLMVEELTATYPDADLILIESGGDNLTLTFSPALADYQLYVIDVAGGRQDPAQAWPGDHADRSAGDQQDRPGPLCRCRPGGDAARLGARAR